MQVFSKIVFVAAAAAPSMGLKLTLTEPVSLNLVTADALQARKAALKKMQEKAAVPRAIELTDCDTELSDCATDLEDAPRLVLSPRQTYKKREVARKET